MILTRVSYAGSICQCLETFWLSQLGWGVFIDICWVEARDAANVKMSVMLKLRNSDIDYDEDLLSAHHEVLEIVFLDLSFSAKGWDLLLCFSWSTYKFV